MKIFGISIFTLAMIAIAFFAGTKYPNALSGIPGLNKL